MRCSGLSLLFIGFSLVAGVPLRAQQLSFRYLGSEKGLNSTTSYACTFDHHGFIWLATIDGLVRFDGREVKYFDHQMNPDFPADQLSAVFCDHQNAIWVCTDKGLAKVDANLQVERQLVKPDEPDLKVYYCMEAADSTIIGITAEGSFSRAYEEKIWRPLPWLDSLLLGRRFWDVRRFDRDRYLIAVPSEGVLIINTKSKRQDAFIPYKGINCVARYDDQSILIGSSNTFQLIRVQLDKPSVLQKISPPSFFTQNDVHEEINYMVRASDGKVYVTTSGRGLICYDSTLTTATQYLHDPLNPSTVISNSLKYVAADEKGNLAVASLDGLNYTNVNNTAVEYLNYLKTSDGEITDQRVLSLAEDKHHRLWMCGRDQVFIYNPASGITQKMVIPAKVKLKSDQIFPAFVERDRNNFIWVALRGEGIFLYDPDGRYVRNIRQSDFPGFANFLDRIRIMRDGYDGYMYVGTENGLVRIGHEDFRLDTFINEPPMIALRRERIVDILPEKEGLWISSSPRGAAWHYSFPNKKLKKYTTENGLKTNRIYGLMENGDGNVYVGSFYGFSIIHPDDSITNMLKGEGLISSRIESVEAAADGSIWMTNNYNLLKYVPATQKMYKIGGRQGLRNVNFVIMSSTTLSSGKMAFGAMKGFVIVDPATIKVESDPLRVFIFLTDAAGKEIEILPGTRLQFNYKEQHLRFSFAVNDLMLADQVLYRYRLTSPEESSWSTPSLNAEIDFNLNPGKYSLEVEAFDGHTWSAYAQPLHFSIQPPWWKQGLFLILMGLSLVLGIWFVFKGRIEKYKRELIITRQIADLESKALRAQMNPHFVFNSLNAIQECIVTGKIDEAYTYLSKFSRLLRMVLEHSDMTEVSLQAEMEVLNLYISLEKLRFKEDMKIDFEINEELDTEEILIPPMLIQPHLENAIWHGLRDRNGEKLLTVSINEKIPGYLDVIVADNGIGRVKAGHLKKNSLGRQKHQSRGSKLSENRMNILKIRYPLTTMQIEDVYNEEGEAKGTRVHLQIPILEKKSMPPNSSTP